MATVKDIAIKVRRHIGDMSKSKVNDDEMLNAVNNAVNSAVRIVRREYGDNLTVPFDEVALESMEDGIGLPSELNDTIVDYVVIETTAPDFNTKRQAHEGWKSFLLRDVSPFVGEASVVDSAFHMLDADIRPRIHKC